MGLVRGRAAGARSATSRTLLRERSVRPAAARGGGGGASSTSTSSAPKKATESSTLASGTRSVGGKSTGADLDGEEGYRPLPQKAGRSVASWG